MLQTSGSEYEQLNVINHIINHGSVFLWVLVICSVLVLAIMIERSIFYYKRSIKVIPLFNIIKQFLIENRLDDAIAYCSAFNHYLTNMVGKALESIHHQGKDLSTIRLQWVEESMDHQKIQEKYRLENLIGFLATMGNIAPFIGLLGTVVGILYAFNALAQEAAKLGPKTIMKDISEALIATALGLLVAIPSVIAYNFFSRKVRRSLTEMDMLATLLLSNLKTYQNK